MQGIMVGFERLTRPLRKAAEASVTEAMLSAQRAVKPVSLSVGGMGVGSPGSFALKPPASALSDAAPGALQSGGSARMGDTIVVQNLNITVPFEDLAQLNQLQKYADMVSVLVRKKGISG